MTNAVAFGVVFSVFYCIRPVTAASYLDWFFKACIVGVITLVVFVGCNYIFNKKELINSATVLLKRDSNKA